jgi:hypothetical protein
MVNVELVRAWAAEASHWDDHPDYSVADWMMEVRAENTRQSYKEWIVSEAQAQEDES